MGDEQFPVWVEPSIRLRGAGRVVKGNFFIDVPPWSLREVADALHDLADENEAT
ncbi:hypothetical protein I1A62_13575 [Rhodococcus sp. USK10]|uniref:hypothetical protein n=1 Tax=Rhodococcus sp. USK10 TaxID=2789739 RepID=UPI001C5F81A5|nr:hypothetical protein [Rhodococcus sp. USK10]QYB05410.1 hypothetical protein I1A62_13575 [Rhodococcus sp. USK10]